VARLLLVDDEPAIRHAFRRALQSDSLQITEAGSAAEAVAAMTAAAPDLVVLDVNLPDAGGLEAFSRLHAMDGRTPIILMTGNGTTDLAIEAMKNGAYEYLLKPLDLPTLKRLVEQALESGRRMRVPAILPEEPQNESADALAGKCPAMQEVYKTIGKVAATDVTVLIIGESGTGKELVARAIYQHSRRGAMPFLAVNCAALPEAIVESELFGHERGSFTGADRKRIGKFEQASGGTVFLDEVGELSPLAQAKMLRILQDQRFERVGGNESVFADVRIIAATNVDLETAVASGRFRQDLLFRLDVVCIRLPPLRERGDDVRLLTDHFLHRLQRSLPSSVEEIDPESHAALARYSWPGNVRELQSVLKQALLMSRDRVLLPDALPPHIRNAGAAAAASNVNGGWARFVEGRLQAGTEDLYAESLALMETEIVAAVLRHTSGNQVQAARILGITRGSLRNKIRLHGITLGRTVDVNDADSID
jgi:two-component system response regulator AtoC